MIEMSSKITIARGQSSSCLDPILDLFTTTGGVRVNVAVLEFVIFELVTDPMNPTQVYPGVGRAPVDVGNSCDDGGNQISTGHFVADWTVLDAALTGDYVIQWFFKLNIGSPEQTHSELFEVVPVVGLGIDDLYTTVQALRDEGVPATKYDDDYLLGRIEIASRTIDLFTRRFFHPKHKVIRVDGRGVHTLRLGDPIIKIDRVEIVSELDEESVSAISLNSLRIYNRHLVGDLTESDDRNDPRISLFVSDANRIRIAFDSSRFPRGRQNILVEGDFGYTDPDGTATGRTPLLISEATKLLALKNLPKKVKSIKSPVAGTIWKQQTREQRVESGEPSRMAIQGAFTGDPAIDQIIAAYRRPPRLGSPNGHFTSSRSMGGHR